MLRYTWEWKPTRSQSQNLNTKEGRHFFLWEKKLKERNCGGIELCLSPHQKEENITFILQIETLFILSSYISTITFWALCCLHQMSEIQSRLLFASISFGCNKIQTANSMTAWSSHSIHWQYRKKYQLGY